MFVLEKAVWTHHDFEQMGWHDAAIYGLAIQKPEDSWMADFVLDIDYIFQWVQPVEPAKTFTFWVAPCTLVFKNCFDLHIDFRTVNSSVDLIDISELVLRKRIQDGNKIVYEWVIELQGGQITLKSHGLEQIVRKRPIHIDGQVLSLAERGGTGFGRKPCE